MKRIALLFFTIAGLSAADALTVDPSGKVGIGTATPTSTLDVAGTATATNVIVNRASQAAATEAVRGDDPRMTNARPANGGNAATVGGLAPSAFVATTQKGAANGVATLDASGKIPSIQIPAVNGVATYAEMTGEAVTLPSGYQILNAGLTGTVSAGITFLNGRCTFSASAAGVYRITMMTGCVEQELGYYTGVRIMKKGIVYKDLNTVVSSFGHAEPPYNTYAATLSYATYVTIASGDYIELQANSYGGVGFMRFCMDKIGN